jgi:hypothetical protein
LLENTVIYGWRQVFFRLWEQVVAGSIPAAPTIRRDRLFGDLRPPRTGGRLGRMRP